MSTSGFRRLCVGIVLTGIVAFLTFIELYFGVVSYGKGRAHIADYVEEMLKLAVVERAFAAFLMALCFGYVVGLLLTASGLHSVCKSSFQIKQDPPI